MPKDKDCISDCSIGDRDLLPIPDAISLQDTNVASLNTFLNQEYYYSSKEFYFTDDDGRVLKNVKQCGEGLDSIQHNLVDMKDIQTENDHGECKTILIEQQLKERRDISKNIDLSVELNYLSNAGINVGVGHLLDSYDTIFGADAAGLLPEANRMPLDNAEKTSENITKPPKAIKNGPSKRTKVEHHFGENSKYKDFAKISDEEAMQMKPQSKIFNSQQTFPQKMHFVVRLMDILISSLGCSTGGPSKFMILKLSSRNIKLKCHPSYAS